jgi:hypothetical protein
MAPFGKPRRMQDFTDSRSEPIPSNISNELYESTQAGIRDTAGLALKFNVTQLLGKGFCRNHE